MAEDTYRAKFRVLSCGLRVFGKDFRNQAGLGLLDDFAVHNVASVDTSQHQHAAEDSTCSAI